MQAHSPTLSNEPAPRSAQLPSSPHTQHIDLSYSFFFQTGEGVTFHCEFNVRVKEQVHITARSSSLTCCYYDRCFRNHLIPKLFTWMWTERTYFAGNCLIHLAYLLLSVNFLVWFLYFLSKIYICMEEKKQQVPLARIFCFCWIKRNCNYEL